VPNVGKTFFWREKLVIFDFNLQVKLLANPSE
jgi:hypothetical protein